MGLNELEIEILKSIQNIRCGFLDDFFSGICCPVNYGILWIATAVILIIFKKTRKIGVFMGIALALNGVLTNLLAKVFITRLRPYDFDKSLEIVKIGRQIGYSFPSGHAACSFSAVTVLLLRAKKPYGIIALVYAAAVSFARMYLCVHYPTDVLGGVAVGTMCGIFGIVLGKKIVKKLPEKWFGES